MKQTFPTLALSLALAASVFVPVRAADKEQRQMMADLRMLQEQQQQIQNAVMALTEALKSVDARLGKRLDEQAEAARKAAADQKLVVDNISRDLGVVREKLDDNNVRVGTLSQEVDALRELVQQQAALARPAPSDTVDFGGGTSPVDPTAPAATAGPAPAVATLGASPQKLLESANSDYAVARSDLAILGYEAYIKSFPRSDLADDAQASICSAYVQQGNYLKAVEACDIAIRTYPSGNAIPEAYYRKGLALQNLKQVDAAREAYQTLIQKYPESAAAILATQQLSGLKKP